jgi:hypothetical protein
MYIVCLKLLYCTNKDIKDDKVKCILDIWSDNAGVVSLDCFQNAISDDALTREASMIDAIGKV